MVYINGNKHTWRMIFRFCKNQLARNYDNSKKYIVG
jgi:hypothetical protein